jgi:hypothetical protein
MDSALNLDAAHETEGLIILEGVMDTTPKGREGDKFPNF